MPYEVGTAFLQIAPSLRGIDKLINAEAKKWGLQAGKTFGAAFNEALRGTRDIPFGPGERESTKKGSDAGGAFARSFKARVDAALRALPDIKVGADTSVADAKLVAIRAELKELSDKRIGVDLDAASALAQLDRLLAQLRQVNRETADPQIRADTAAATAELQKFRAEVDKVGAARPNVQVTADTARADGELLVTKALADSLGRSSPTISPNVDDGQAVTGITRIRYALLGLGAALAAPLVPGIVAMIGPLAAATVGFAGLAAVAIPSLAHIKTALDAQKKAQQQAAASAQQYTEQERSAARAVADARTSLANTTRTADEQAINSAEQVADARRSLARTEVDAANSVRDAERQLIDVRAQAADAIAAAEQQVTDAQRDSRQAQDDLNTARIQARQNLVDMTNALRDAHLEERRDTLSVQEAWVNLQKVQSDPHATEIARREARLTFDEAKQRLREQQDATKRTATEKAKADKAGIDGSRQVQDAQQRYADTQRSQQQAEKGLAQARTNSAQQIAAAEQALARARVDSAQRIGDAERSLSGALRDQRQQQADSAAAVTQAQLQLNRALADQKRVGSDANTATAAAKRALDKLTPSERAAMRAWVDFKDAYKDWVRELQPKVLPLVTGALKLLGQAAKPLAGFVDAAAGAFGGLETGMGKAMRSKYWQDFATLMQQMTGPAISGIGQFLGDIAHGVAGIITAFAPVTAIVQQGLLDLSGRFATFGENLAKDPHFADFVQTMQDLRKPMVDVLSALGTFLVSLVSGLSKIMVPIYKALTPLLTALADVSSALADDLAPALDTLVKPVQRVINVLGRQLVRILRDPGFQKALVGIGRAFGQMLDALRPLVKPLGDVIIAAAPLAEAFIQFSAVMTKQLAVPIKIIAGALRLLASGLRILDKLGIISLGAKLAAFFYTLPATILEKFAGLVRDFGPALIHGFMDGVMAAVHAITGSWLWRTFVSPIIDAVKSLFGIHSPSTVFADIGGDVIAGFLNGIKAAAKAVFRWFRNLADKVGDAIGTTAKWLVDKGKHVIGGLWGGIKSAARDVWTWFGNVHGWIEDKFDRAARWLVGEGGDVIGGLLGGIKAAAQAVWTWFGKVAGWVKDKFTDAGDWLYNKGKSVLGGLWDGIKDKAQDLWDWLTDLPGKLAGFFAKAGDWLKDAGTAIAGGLTGAISDGLSGLGGFFRKPLNWIITNVINKFLGLIGKIPGTPDWFDTGIALIPGGKPPASGGGGGGGAGGGHSGAVMAAADGGVMPGHTPGRDVHHFYSPTAGSLHLSGGEAFMVPQFTRRMGGPRGIAALNAWARRGSGGPHFRWGGVGDFVSGVGHKVWGGAKAGAGAVASGARWLGARGVGLIIDGAVKTVTAVIDHTMPFRDMFKSMARHVVTSISDGLVDWIKGNGKNRPRDMDGQGGGLRHADGGVLTPFRFDTGGVLHPGQLAYNGTRQPESVFTDQQLKAIIGSRSKDMRIRGPVRMRLENVDEQLWGVVDDMVIAGVDEALDWAGVKGR